MGFGLWGQVYNVSRYSREDGLVQSQVMTLLENHQGYLWLGTHRGIDRFDGMSFHNVQEGLSGNFIEDLMEDRDGNIWIATENGLDFYNGFSIRSLSSRKGMDNGGYSSLNQDPQGRVWIGTNGYGLWLAEKDSFVHNPYDPDSLMMNLSIRDILCDSRGRVWIATLSGLFIWEEGKNIRPSRIENLDQMEVLSLFEDRRQQIWIGTQLGVYRLGERTSYYTLSNRGFSDPRVFAITEDQNGEIWLGTGNGIGIIDTEKDAAFPFQADDERLNIKLTSAMEDSEGNLWFGSDGGGLIRITEGVFQTFSGRRVLRSNLAKSFLEDRDGNIWVSSKDQGISVLGDGRLIRNYTEENGLGGQDICSSFEDSKGNFWFASYNGTLTRYDQNRFTVFSEDQGLQANAVYWVSEDRKGRLWIGTDHGISTYQSGKISHTYGVKDSLPSATVYNILPTRKRIWIGTKSGLAYVEEGRIFTFDGDTAIGNNVITLEEDPRGRIWVGSSKGLACIEEGKARWVKISGTQGAHTVVSLITEAQRYLWVGTENGAYRLDLREYSPDLNKNPFEHYIEKDGLLSKECNANAIFRDSRGGIWIGTSNGASYRPQGSERRRLTSPPALYITKILDKSPQDWLPQYELNDMNLPKNLELPYTQTRVDFEFIGISLKSPEQVEYRYQLKGVDKDWQKPTHTTSVFYPNLDPGSYTFMITAKRETEPWNYDYAKSYSFVITPPFWQENWFLILIFLSIFSIGYYFYHSYIHQRRQQIEEQKIRNTAEKLQLEHQALYAMMNPHFTFNALQSIQNYIQRNDKKTAHKFLSSFAKLVRKNLDSTKVDYISLGEEIDRLKLYMGLEKMRFPEKFDYQVRIDSDLDLSETKIPPMVLQPFVENSIKHGIMSLEEGGLIEINISQKNEDYLSIDIRDNGIGIEASKQRRRNRPNDHVSKGMQITQDRLALFARMTEKEYFLDIKEEKDETGKVRGTLVHMTLPMHVGPLEFSF